ncbi:MAG: hypothetical protein ACQEQO_12360, partial [Thermodesulfobacteriota bacterium]
KNISRRIVPGCVGRRFVGIIFLAPLALVVIFIVMVMFRIDFSTMAGIVKPLQIFITKLG